MTESGETVVEVAIDDLEASNVRRLTPTECELLQGFRSGYTKPMEGDSPRYAALGNSWATNCAEFVIRGIHREDGR